MDQIQAILNDLTPEERAAVMTILQEQSIGGTSESLNELYQADWEELPVDIDTFLESPRYLGKSTDGGKAIYPYWRNAYREIIEKDKVECALGGSIGCGKTTAAVYLMTYFTYKLMCLKNIRQYYALEGNGPISICFLNNTIKLSQGVAYDKFMSTLATSPWFLERGEVRGTVNLRYVPNKNIDFIVGSSADQIIGRDIFCLSGDTKIPTELGTLPLEVLAGKEVKVLTLNDHNQLEISEKPCKIVCTKQTTIMVHIYLRNGKTLKCTPEHKFLMADGGYEEAGNLIAGDRLYSTSISNGTPIEDILLVKYNSPQPVFDVLNVPKYSCFAVDVTDGELSACMENNIGYIISHNCAILDEVNFNKGADIQFEKNKVLETYNACYGRIKNRFTVNGKCQGRIFLISSKKTEYDFLNQYIDKKMQSPEDSKHLYVADAKAFEVKPKGSYSGRMFRVAVGGSNLESKIPTDDETTEELIHQGYEVYDVPIELRGDFELDINRFIADHLGISVSEVIKFIPYTKLEQCYKEIVNPFAQEVFEANLNDKVPVKNHFMPHIVSETITSKPIFIHIDTSGGKKDNCGISAIAAMGFVNRNRYSEASGQEETTKQMLYRHVFSAGLNARKNSEISYQKLVDFLWYLKFELGWNIKAVSTDGYMGQFLRQQISASLGGEVNYISLDRTPEGYLTFQSILAEQRLAMIKLNLLESEIVRLERNNVTGKVDHPPIDGCFTGDTKVSLVDGRDISILDLKQEFDSGKANYVYTCNEQTHEIEPKLIQKVFWTKTAPIVEVELDNGEIIRCTAEHKFLLRSGQYVEAQLLKSGDSLMPLYRKVSENGLAGYRLYYSPSDNKWHYEHRQFCAESAGKGYVVHHKNFNKLDNTPENLEVMTTKDHRAFHNRMQSEAERCKRSNSIKDWHSKMKNSPEYEARREACRQGTLRYYAAHPKRKSQAPSKTPRILEIERTFGVIWENLTLSQKNSYGNKLSRMKDPTITQRISATLSKRHKEGRFDNAIAALRAHNESMKGIARSEEIKQKISQKAISRSSYKNHKVVAVRFTDRCEDVFDISVSGTPNFALAAGVFVHNSKDIADSLAGALYNASLHEATLDLGSADLIDAIVDFNKREPKVFHKDMHIVPALDQPESQMTVKQPEEISVNPTIKPDIEAEWRRRQSINYQSVQSSQDDSWNPSDMILDI